MVLDIAAYNKDIVSDAAARLVSLFDPASGRDNDFRILTNLTSATPGASTSGWTGGSATSSTAPSAYAFQQAKNTGSDPFTYINFGSPDREPGGRQQRGAAAAAGHPADRRQPAARADRRLLASPSPTTGSRARWRVPSCANVSVFATFRYTSGTRVHQVRREQRGAERALDRELRAALPRGAQHPAAPRPSRRSTPGSPRASGWAGWT